MDNEKTETRFFDGFTGLIVPVVELDYSEDIIANTELTLERNQGKTTFQFYMDIEMPKQLTITTVLQPVSLLPDSDHSDLPYDIYKRVNQFSLQVDQDIEVISESRSYLPTMSATSLTDQQIDELLNKFEIPLTFDLDEVREAISGLSEPDIDQLRENRLISRNHDPNWSLKRHIEMVVEKPTGGGGLTVSYPLFPENSYSSRPGVLEDAFCATDDDSYAFMMISQHNGGVVPFTYHSLDLEKYMNLTQLHLKTGRVEGTASCIEGEREFEGMDITIMNPTPQNGREASVMFFAP